MPNTPRFTTPWNFQFTKIHTEVNKMPSLTVPDAGYTIKEILQKFSKGIDPMLTKLGEYEFENGKGIESLEDENDFEFDDLTSVDSAMEELRAIEFRKKQIEDYTAQKKKEGENIQPVA